MNYFRIFEFMNIYCTHLYFCTIFRDRIEKSSAVLAIIIAYWSDHLRCKWVYWNVARRRPGSTGFNIFSSELSVNGYPFKRSNSLLDKGQLSIEKNLLLQSKFFPLRVDPV